MRFILSAFLFLSCLILQGLTDPAMATLLASPNPMTFEELEERVKSYSLEMKWPSIDAKSGQKGSLGFHQKNGQTTLQIQFEESYPQELTPFEDRFTFSTPQGKKVWTFLYGEEATGLSKNSSDAPLSLEEIMGIVHPPRILENQNPQVVSLPEIEELVRGKHCVFYTGAGISAGVVPTMPQLMKSLQLEGCREKGEFSTLLQQAIKDPISYIKPMDHFYQACLFGDPTPAHLAIRDIVQKKNWGLLTENLDLLHQRSGINPLHHDGKDWLKSNVTESDLNKIDYVITVGLAGDESGFMGWYKSTHPGGTIIAIKLHQPNYLGNADMLVAGDVQQLLPLLREAIF